MCTHDTSTASEPSLRMSLSGQFIQPSGSPATEVMNFSVPEYCLPWLPAMAHYLRQNLLIFLHVPKYTDSNTAHHFKVWSEPTLAGASSLSNLVIQAEKPVNIRKSYFPLTLHWPWLTQQHHSKCPGKHSISCFRQHDCMSYSYLRVLGSFWFILSI